MAWKLHVITALENLLCLTISINKLAQEAHLNPVQDPRLEVEGECRLFRQDGVKTDLPGGRSHATRSPEGHQRWEQLQLN